MISLQLRDAHLEKELVFMDRLVRLTVTDYGPTESTVFFEQKPYENGRLFIGKYCSFASRTSFILGSNHNTKRITTHIPDYFVEDISKTLKTKGDIVIENDVWIGMGATILSGVKIGTGAVIGANSVVSSDVGPYSIVAGNPAREVRKRFNEKQIELLLQSKWWDWTPKFIESNRHIIFSEDFSLFEDLCNKIESEKINPHL